MKGAPAMRKILKIFISLLFLAVTALAAVFAIKAFMPDWFGQEDKYGVKPVAQELPVVKEPMSTTTRPIPDEAYYTDKYGVAPMRLAPSREPQSMESKYGVVPVRWPTRDRYGEKKYGVAPIRHDNQTKN